MKLIIIFFGVLLFLSNISAEGTDAIESIFSRYSQSLDFQIGQFKVRLTKNGSADYNLGYTIFKGARSDLPAQVMIVGRAESSIEYMVAIEKLRKQGFERDIIVLDLPDQGLSERFHEGLDSTHFDQADRATHLNSAENLGTPIFDALEIIRQQRGQRSHVVAHSTGGLGLLVTLASFDSAAVKKLIYDRVVLVSPLMGLAINVKGVNIDTGYLGRAPINTFLKLNEKKKSSELLTGLRDINETLRSGLERNALSTDFESMREVYTIRRDFQKMLLQTPLVPGNTHDQFKMKSLWVPATTVGWLRTVNSSLDEIDRRPERLASFGVNLILAGDDSVISNKAATDFVERNRKNGSHSFKIIKIDEAWHALHFGNMEVVGQLNEMMEQTRTWPEALAGKSCGVVFRSTM